MAYILITAVALVFLNIYAGVTMRKLVFSAQENSMLDKAQLIATSLGGGMELTQDSVSQTIDAMEDVHMTRIVVTDPSGYAVYDTMRVQNEQGKLLLLPEIVQALGNQDVLYCRYDDGVLESRAAMPVFSANQLVGAVYLMEHDVEEGAMIATLQTNILRISLVLEGAVICFSVLFSAAFSRRMRRILESIRTVRKGDYSNKIKIKGHDEVEQLANEFNDLTDRLQVSEQRRRQFVSDASHELKTPLASIKLLTDSILQNEMDLATVREFVGDIGGEADRLTRLSQKLLELTKVDSHADEEREVIDAASVADRVVRMLTPIAQQREITIELHAAAGCTVMTVEDDLYQILFNLAENGLKYNLTGGWLGISVQRTEEDVILVVSDNGVGIPPEAMGYIFERFYRVDKARSREAGGAGLGLSIVHDMVERNYGSISVAARDGGGTSFTVVFPYIDMEVGE